MITPADTKFLKRLNELAPTSRCIRANIAAIVAKGAKTLVEYCNHPMSLYDCTKIGCIRNIQNIKSGTQREICYGLCAEQYVISMAAEKGLSLKGATIYISKHPCRICESMICVSGIKRVVFIAGYPDVLPNFNPFEDYKIETIQAPAEFRPIQTHPACTPGSRCCD